MQSTNEIDYSILSRKYRRMGLDREADLLSDSEKSNPVKMEIENMGETDIVEVKQTFLEKLLEAIKNKKGPLLVIKLPLLGSVSALFVSHFSGNGIFWNILHFCLSWYYVVFKLAKLIFGS